MPTNDDRDGRPLPGPRAGGYTGEASVAPPRVQTFDVRGQRVVLGSDIARLFGVETKRLNQQLRRNLERFAGYAFQLGRRWPRL